MDEGVDEGRDLALDDEVAGRLEVGNNLSQASAELNRSQDETFFLVIHMRLSLFTDLNLTKRNSKHVVLLFTDLLDEVHDLLLGGVAGDELVDVSHDVHADVACEVIPGLREGGGAEDKKGETEENLEE